MSDFEELYGEATANNEKGLSGVTTEAEPEAITVALPAQETGSIVVIEYESRHVITILNIQAHDCELCALSVTHNGGYVASASIDCPQVKIHATSDGRLIHSTLCRSIDSQVSEILYHPFFAILAIASKDSKTIEIIQ